MRGRARADTRDQQATGGDMRVRDFSVLTFDCYGTLIDWETGIVDQILPWLEAHGATPSRDALLKAFGQRESHHQEASPGLRYPELLARVHQDIARDFDVAPDDEAARAFGHSVGDWPAFPDSPGALAYLKRHYKLVILSNVDHGSFRLSAERLGVGFDAVFTAEDIGSYKPDPRNFQYMLDRLAELGVDRREILHTAESLHHDHVQAKRFGLATCWISRRAGHGRTASGREGTTITPDFRFETLDGLAEAHRAEAPASAT
jgi:2-haloalkanoic acid dehalogenase type II